MFKIAVIDEVEDERRHFKRALHTDFDVIAMPPESEVNQMVDVLLQGNFDAIITDFNLKEIDPSIRYDGVDLVTAFQEVKHDFPCFVLSSYDHTAAEKAEDVNYIYVKAVLNDTTANLTFKERVRLQIEKYRTRIDRSESELSNLLEKRRNEGLTAIEEERLIELDHFIESATYKEGALPKDIKYSTVSDQFKSLIARTEELIDKLKGC